MKNFVADTKSGHNWEFTHTYVQCKGSSFLYDAFITDDAFITGDTAACKMLLSHPIYIRLLVTNVFHYPIASTKWSHQIDLVLKSQRSYLYDANFPIFNL